MPLELPMLDDRPYPDLVREGVALIPRYAPEWTDHNPSDPGITLLELFAYLAEIYLYRVDRISDAARSKFLRLLGGEAAGEDAASRAERLCETVRDLRKPSRAVSAGDFEALALEALRQHGRGEVPVSRIYCLPRRDLEARTTADRRRDRPNHVSVVFVPRNLSAPDEVVQAMAEDIRAYLEPRRLLTTRVHVVPPRFVDTAIGVRATAVSPKSAASAKTRMEEALRTFMNPAPGGWPLGRSLYGSELYRLLTQVEGVSRLEAVELSVTGHGQLLKSDDGDVVGVNAGADEVLRLRVVDVVVQP